MYQKSFYEKIRDPLSELVLEQIEDINKNGATADKNFWEEKYNFCIKNFKMKDINALKQHIVNAPNCPHTIVENLIYKTTAADIIIDALKRNEVFTTTSLSYALGMVTDARIKKEFKNAVETTDLSPFNQSIIEYMVVNHSDERFGGYHLRYTTNQKKVEDMLREGVHEDAVSEIINNKNLQDSIRLEATEYGYNIDRINNVTPEIADVIFESAKSTIYGFDSSDKSLKDARTIASNAIRSMIDKGLLLEEQEEELYKIYLNDKDKGNRKTNTSFIQKIATNTTSPYLLSNIFKQEVCMNPFIAPSRVDFLLNHTLEHEAKYKVPGSTTFVDIVNKLTFIYRYKTLTVKEEMKGTQMKLMEFIRKCSKSDVLPREFDKLCEEVAMNPATSENYLAEIRELGMGKHINTKSALLATTMMKLQQSNLTYDECRKAIDVVNDGENVYPELETNICKVLINVIKQMKLENEFKFYKGVWTKKLELLENNIKENETFNNKMFIKSQLNLPNHFHYYELNYKEFAKLSKEEKEQFVKMFTKPQLRLIDEALVNQIKRTEKRYDLYDKVPTLRDLSEMISDRIKELKREEDIKDIDTDEIINVDKTVEASKINHKIEAEDILL